MRHTTQRPSSDSLGSSEGSSASITTSHGQLGLANRRRGARGNQYLRITCTFRRSIGNLPAGTKIAADIFDVSRTGAGIQFQDTFVLDPVEARGTFLTLEVALPDFGKPLAVKAEIKWCKPANSRQRALRFGVQFFDPSPELLTAMAEVCSAGKKDEQYLWNLWETHRSKQ